MELEESAIARWPRVAGLNRRPLHLTDRDHLACVRLGQLAPAGQTAKLPDSRQILAHFLLRFFHSPALSMHHNRLMMQSPPDGTMQIRDEPPLLKLRRAKDGRSQTSTPRGGLGLDLFSPLVTQDFHLRP